MEENYDTYGFIIMFSMISGMFLKVVYKVFMVHSLYVFSNLCFALAGTLFLAIVMFVSFSNLFFTKVPRKMRYAPHRKYVTNK